MVDRLIEQLRNDLGYEEPLLARDDGSFLLDFEPDLHISVKEHMEGGVMLYSLLAPLPRMNREEFLKSCMVGNLFGRETGGATLGVDERGENLCLNYFLAGDLNYREFRDAFEDFVNYSDAWRRDTLVFAEVNSEN